MYSEEELLPISALQHFVFCPRQCALIHVEKLWVENILTYQGRYLHKNVHGKGHEKRKEQRKEKSLQIASYVYGIFGEADMVEFYADGTVHIVEHKRGRPKTHQADEIQLCAQAICLEEMLEKKIEYGFLFYNEIKRREKIIFDEEIRKATVKTINAFRDMIAKKYTLLFTACSCVFIKNIGKYTYKSIQYCNKSVKNCNMRKYVFTEKNT